MFSILKGRVDTNKHVIWMLDGAIDDLWSCSPREHI